MAKRHGVNTKVIGEQLKERLDADPTRFKDVRVFYDHGESSRSEVCEPTAYMGRRYGKDAKLSVVDIVVTRGKSVMLAIEIEENTVRPKAVLGDIFSIALADAMRIQNDRYSLQNATIIVGLAEDGTGTRTKQYERLERLLDRYFKAKPSRIKRARIVTCPTNDLVRRIERLIRLETGRAVR